MLPDLSRLSLAPTPTPAAVGVPLPRGEALREEARWYDRIEMLAVQLFDADTAIADPRIVLPAKDDLEGRKLLLQILEGALTLKPKKEIYRMTETPPSADDQAYLKREFATRLVEVLEQSREVISYDGPYPVFEYDLLYNHLKFLERLVRKYNYQIARRGDEAPPTLPDEEDEVDDAIVRLRRVREEQRRRVALANAAIAARRSAAAKKAAETRKRNKEAKAKAVAAEEAQEQSVSYEVVYGEVEVIPMEPVEPTEPESPSTKEPPRKKKVMSRLGGVAGMGGRAPAPSGDNRQDPPR